MATIIPECGVCEFTFNQGLNKPLVLPCGHTCCHSCLSRIASDKKLCPMCRKHFDIKLSKLPVNYMLIPATDAKSSTTNHCPSHQKEIDFWCMSCEVTACKKCFTKSHVGHPMILLDDFQEKDDVTTDERQRCKGKINVQLDDINELTSVCDKAISLNSTIHKGLTNYKLELATMQQELKSAEIALSGGSRKSSTEKAKLIRALADINTINNSSSTTHDELSKHFEEFQQYASSFTLKNKNESPQEETLADNEPWTIHGQVDAARALLSLERTNHRPTQATVATCRQNPTPQLPVLLDSLAKVTNEINLLLLDSFWAGDEMGQDFRVTDFIKNHARKLKCFLGSTEAGRVYLEETSEQSELIGPQQRQLGVHLKKCTDVEFLASQSDELLFLHICLDRNITNFDDCSQCQVPISLNCSNFCLHFPDLHDSHLPWMITMMEFFKWPLNMTWACLPRSQVSYDGLQKLLDWEWQNHVVLCIQDSSLHLQEKIAIEELAMRKHIMLHWTIRFNELQFASSHNFTGPIVHNTAIK